MTKTFLRRFTQLVKDLRYLGVLTPKGKIRLICTNGVWHIFDEDISGPETTNAYFQALEEEFPGEFVHYWQDVDGVWHLWKG